MVLGSSVPHRRLTCAPPSPLIILVPEREKERKESGDGFRRGIHRMGSTEKQVVVTGQILDTDDLSASHLTSPRSGTPVKLLGREDANVDWYNLEKSKCVKAFRCGEFDDCIEKAESAEGMPLKKREKYARREDAILHALELERQLLKKQAKLGMASDRIGWCRSSNTLKKDVVTLPAETLGNDNEKHANLKSYVSGENEIAKGPFPSEVARDGNQLSGEVNISEEIP